MRNTLATSLVALTLLPSAAGHAESPGKRIPGYQCMMLNLTEQQSMDPTVHIPVRASPSNSAPAVGWAGAVVIVREPLAPVNGFLQILFPDGRQLWISADMLRPYHSLGNPRAKCVPMTLPNGRIGFGSAS